MTFPCRRERHRKGDKIHRSQYIFLFRARSERKKSRREGGRKGEGGRREQMEFVSCLFILMFVFFFANQVLFLILELYSII